jgi:hypothetical protein
VHPIIFAYGIFILLDEENCNLRGVGIEGGGDARKARATKKAMIKATTPERKNIFDRF